MGGPAGLNSTDPKDLMRPFRDALDAVHARTELRPRVGIILGTGLGALGDAIEIDAVVPYEAIPGFPLSTVESHSGRLLVGGLDGVPAVAMQGRFHRYEGYSLSEVTFPVRIMRMMGAETLVVSGACGGLDPLMSLGDLVLLDDHINLIGDSPLVGANLEELGPRFPDMSEPFDQDLQRMALRAAVDRGIKLQRGIYAAVVGPNLETRAEYRMLRQMGASVVGMSTVPEVIAARHMNMRVLGLTIVTDLCLPDCLEAVDIATIIRTAGEAEPDLTSLIRDVVRGL